MGYAEPNAGPAGIVGNAIGVAGTGDIVTGMGTGYVENMGAATKGTGVGSSGMMSLGLGFRVLGLGFGLRSGISGSSGMMSLGSS